MVRNADFPNWDVFVLSRIRRAEYLTIARSSCEPVRIFSWCSRRMLYQCSSVNFCALYAKDQSEQLTEASRALESTKNMPCLNNILCVRTIGMAFQVLGVSIANPCSVPNNILLIIIRSIPLLDRCDWPFTCSAGKSMHERFFTAYL